MVAVSSQSGVALRFPPHSIRLLDLDAAMAMVGRKETIP